MGHQLYNTRFLGGLMRAEARPLRAIPAAHDSATVPASPARPNSIE